MKHTLLHVSAVGLAAALLLNSGISAFADESPRQQQMEVFAIGQWSGSGKVTSFRFSDNFLGGLGVAIISTSSGLLTDRQCAQKGVGGEVLAYVW